MIKLLTVKVRAWPVRHHGIAHKIVFSVFTVLVIVSSSAMFRQDSIPCPLLQGGTLINCTEMGTGPQDEEVDTEAFIRLFDFEPANEFCGDLLDESFSWMNYKSVVFEHGWQEPSGAPFEAYSANNFNQGGTKDDIRDTETSVENRGQMLFGRATHEGAHAACKFSDAAGKPADCDSTDDEVFTDIAGECDTGPAD